MSKFAKKVVVSLGNSETLALGVSECPSFSECDQHLNEELANLNLKHRGVRGTMSITHT